MLPAARCHKSEIQDHFHHKRVLPQHRMPFLKWKIAPSRLFVLTLTSFHVCSAVKAPIWSLTFTHRIPLAITNLQCVVGVNSRRKRPEPSILKKKHAHTHTPQQECFCEEEMHYNHREKRQSITFVVTG